MFLKMSVEKFPWLESQSLNSQNMNEFNSLWVFVTPHFRLADSSCSRVNELHQQLASNIFFVNLEDVHVQIQKQIGVCAF